MADYVSTLTGVQMDSALLDMAEHNSEAYAVGERNGIAVASDDVTYHNNARYYAQIASSQIVGDASSAVRWDTDQSEALTDAQKAQARENINAASDSDVVKITAQTLTTAQQAQARANIMAGGSNRNLLDNGKFLINQRGVGAVSASDTHPCDRWYLYGAASGTMTVRQDTDKGLVFTGEGNCRIRQNKKDSSLRRNLGRQITLGVEVNGIVYSVTGVVPSSIPTEQTNIIQDTIIQTNAGNILVGFTWQATVESFLVIMRAYAPMTIGEIKLEFGEVSTITNGSLLNYDEELRTCMRYFQRISLARSYTSIIGFGVMQNAATNVRIFIPTSVPFRDDVTLTATAYNLAQILVLGNGQSLTATAMTTYTSVKTGGVLVDVTVNGNAVANQMYVLQLYSASAYIDINGD